jgi:hypothetical protein
MIVIARNNGPNTNGIPNSGHLTKGKKYEIISISIPLLPKGGFKNIFLKENQTIYIPEYGKHNEYFYINVRADDNKNRTYWCDYFLSTKEMRQLKLKQLTDESR